MRRALALLLLLAACGREVVVAPLPAASFRMEGALIASTTRGGPGDMAGEWVVSQAYPGAPLAAPGTRASLTPGTDMGLLWIFEGPGEELGEGPGAVPTAMVAPGRYEGAGARLWVLWVDDDFRTAAIGTPDGSFGWIMDRPGAASPDRTEAARRMLEFNGYDLGRLAG